MSESQNRCADNRIGKSADGTLLIPLPWSWGRINVAGTVDIFQEVCGIALYGAVRRISNVRVEATGTLHLHAGCRIK